MTRLEFREFFKDETGRHNLSDTQIDRLITSASKSLAPKLSGHEQGVFVLVGLPEGQNFIDLTDYLNSVRRVFLLNETSGSSSDNSYTEISIYKTYEGLIKDVGDLSVEGSPTKCAITPTLHMQTAGSMATSLGAVETWTADLAGKHSLLLAFDKLADQRYDLRVFGSRAIKELSSDEDFNYLTVDQPYLLVQEMLWLHEIRMKNYQGAQALKTMINDELRALVLSGTQVDADRMGNQIDG